MTRPRPSPSITFSNCSYDWIKVERGGLWGHRNTRLYVGTGPIGNGGGGTQGFDMENKSDFFGPIRIKWKNAKGEIHTTNLTIAEKDIPTKKFKDMVWDGVHIEFTQDKALFYTNYHPRYEKELKYGNCVLSKERFGVKKPKGYDWMNFKERPVNF